MSLALVLVAMMLLAVAYFIVTIVSRNKAVRQFREKILRYGERLDDAEYSSKMPFLESKQDIKVALKLRAVFARIANLPRECITPGMLLNDLFSINDTTLYDGTDPATLVMEIEDEFGIDIPADEREIKLNFLDDTAASLTHSLVQYARLNREAFSLE